MTVLESAVVESERHLRGGQKPMRHLENHLDFVLAESERHLRDDKNSMRRLNFAAVGFV